MATRDISAPDLAAIPESEIVRPPLMVRLRPYLIALPALLVLIGILYPFVMGVAYSLTPYAFTRPNTDFVGLRNYMRMVEDSDFWYSTFVTLAYAFSATGVQLALGLTVAMLLNRESRVAKILQVTLIFPMMIAPVIATLIWKMMMQPSVGILNPMLNSIGLPSLEWAAVPETALFSVVLIDVWMFTPFAALIMLAGLRSFPQGPFEAARVDGASFWFTFRNLTLPMLTPFILIVIIFRFMDSLKMFDIIFAMTEGGPGNTLMTYQLTAYRTSIQFQRLAQGLPYAIVLYIVIYFVSQWLVKWWGQAQRRAAGYS
ncbi:MAG TPA: sugar ABC transporter permease [Aggregatilineales bacterium]|nr:sugar ABC transporter permease [Anaerolineae bacterium]HUN06860.1 sugar ABC transporter permease [Aggregatilineales bacterium]